MGDQACFVFGQYFGKVMIDTQLPGKVTGGLFVAYPRCRPARVSPFSCG